LLPIKKDASKQTNNQDFYFCFPATPLKKTIKNIHYKFYCFYLIFALMQKSILAAGKILISMPSLDESIFEKTVVFITEHNEKGAMGFIINKIFPRTLNELIEFKDAKSFPLYNGGPVEREHLYFLHQRPDLIEGGIAITDTTYIGGNFKQAITHLDNNMITENDLKIFIGYCGWDPQQLEDEIEEGSWLVIDALSKIVFTSQAIPLWELIYESKE
jgi:putative transcriptional regulator